MQNTGRTQYFRNGSFNPCRFGSSALAVGSSARRIIPGPLTDSVREQERNTGAGGRGARRTRKIVNATDSSGPGSMRTCYSMIVIRRLHWYCNDREDNGEGEGEEKCNSAFKFSPCTRRVPPSAEGHAESGLYPTVCEHHLVLANLTIEGSEGLLYLKTKEEGRSLTDDDPDSL
jgi:hypothetical protein